MSWEFQEQKLYSLLPKLKDFPSVVGLSHCYSTVQTQLFVELVIVTSDWGVVLLLLFQGLEVFAYFGVVGFFPPQHEQSAMLDSISDYSEEGYMGL